MVSRVVNFCDRCEGEKLATTTVALSNDGIALEIDLCDEHQGEWLEFERQRHAWAEAARPKQGTSAPRRRRSATPLDADTAPTPLDAAPTTVETTRHRRPSADNNGAAVREWAAKHGYPVSERGRLPADIVAAFNAENAHDRWDAAAGDGDESDAEHSDAQTSSAVPPPTVLAPPAVLVGRLASASPHFPARPAQETAHG